MVSVTNDPVNNLIIGVIAIIFLVVVANKVINKTIQISKKLGVSQLFIGLTLISIGTSLPEITTHVVASIDILKGNIDPFIASSTVLGTNIGSDIVQQNLIIGIIALIGIIHIKKDFLRKDYLIMIIASVLLFLFALDKDISRVEGFILFFGYLIYLWFLWLREDERMKRLEKEKHKSAHKYDKKAHILYDFLYVIAGLTIIVMSAEYILRVSEFFVVKHNISGSLIGILIIGVASALPELTTSITAILKKSTSISLGTLIGSNITNPMFALGLGAMISGYKVPSPIIVYDLPVKIITSIIILWFFYTKRMISKKEAWAMIGMYIAYVLIRIKFFSVDF